MAFARPLPLSQAPFPWIQARLGCWRFALVAALFVMWAPGCAVVEQAGVHATGQGRPGGIDRSAAPEPVVVRGQDSGPSDGEARGSRAAAAPATSAAPAPATSVAAAGPGGGQAAEGGGDSARAGLSSIARNRANDQFDPDKAPEYPNIHDEPGALYGLDSSQYDRFVFPWLVNLLQEDLWLLDRDPADSRARRLKRSARVDIRDPDPDTANFPNGAYTLPKGRVYIETSPLGLYGPSKVSLAQYNWEVLFRYGVTQNLEFRIFSNGFTATKGHQGSTGFSPLAFDFKANFWEENPKYHIPAVGLEVYIQTTFGSPAFNSGTQPSINLLLDQTLPFEINFEHNFSISGLQGPDGLAVYEFGYQWSFQRELVKDFDVFIQGFYNSASLPRLRGFTLPTPISTSATTRRPTAVVVGGGAIWTVNNRLAIFGSYNVGLTPAAPTTIALIGFAVAM